MPIPFLFIAGAAAAALGIGKGIKAAVDKRDADAYNESSEIAIQLAKENLETARKASNTALESLGGKKLFVLDKSISRFIASFEKLKNVQLEDSAGMDELKKFRLDKQSAAELREMSGYAASILGGTVTGTLGGAKASENLDNAKSNYAEAKELAEELLTAAVLCHNIRRRSYMFERLLIRLDALFFPLVYGMETIITQKGDDWNKFSNEDKHAIAAAASIAQAIKTVLNTPILTEDGKLTDESAQIAEEIKPVFDAYKNA